MKITRIITIDGKTKEEYEKIKSHLESLTQSFPGWNLHYEPLVNRVTAIKVEEKDTLE